MEGRRFIEVDATLGGEASDRVRLREAPLEGMAIGGRRGGARTDDVVETRLSVRFGSLTMRPRVGLGARMGVCSSGRSAPSTAVAVVAVRGSGVADDDDDESVLSC